MSDLADIARAASAVIPAAELHGLVCGLAATRGRRMLVPELIQLAGVEALAGAHAVETFVDAVVEQLDAPDMAFAPIAPEDTAELPERVTALADWCAGFLSGFGAGVGAGTSPDDLPGDVAEILRDFASISGMDEDVDGTEQDEQSFMEIFEYVRVGAVLAITLMREAAGTEDPRS